MTSGGSSGRAVAEADLVVVGAGIVGLAHAVHAVARGASVVVLERDGRARGASIRNFGHGCVTAQSGLTLDYALAARGEWLRLAKEAGFWLRDQGTVVVARADDEYEVLEDFARERDGDVVLLDAGQVRERVPVGGSAVGGAWLPLDVRFDPREAVAAIAAWLAEQGVRFLWSTAMHSVQGEVERGDGIDVHTSRGIVRGQRVVVAVGHDADRHFPALTEAAGMQRCSLHMLQVANPFGCVIDPAVLSGYSMLRYPGFAASPALARVRARLQANEPDAVAAQLNLMFTQRPDGDLVLGDTHTYGADVSPFRSETYDDLVLQHTCALLGVTHLDVRQRWQGVYASAAEPFLVATPEPGVRLVSVTSGVGMTTAFGLAQAVLDDLL